MTYKIQKTDDYMFVVVELDTNKVLFEFYMYEPAHDRYMFYKNGGGFAGYTPDFISKKLFV